MAATLVILLLPLLYRFPRAARSRRAALLGAIIFASVGGIIVQITLFQFSGLGSKYAITKHVFLASTIFIAGLSIALVDLFVKITKSQSVKIALPSGSQNIGVAVLAVSI